MQPRIETSREKKLVGMRLAMSFAQYNIGELWRKFMPVRKEISGHVNDDLISMAVYQPGHFANFSPTNMFERWACVEVSNFDKVPADMETYVLPAGLYAVFDYKGSSADQSIFQYIFGVWLPASNFLLDDRPHFEVLGERYKNNDPHSEEEIWIPVKPRI